MVPVLPNLAITVLVYLVIPPSVAAQAPVAVGGGVEDVTGAALPGAAVTLTGPSPTDAQTTHSQSDGTFTFAAVAPGRYVLTIELDGFESSKQDVTVGATPLPLRIRLRVARVEQSVTVEADASDEALIAESNTSTPRLDENLIQELPVAGDNLLAVIGNFIAPIGLGAEGPSIVVDGVAGGDLDVPSSALNRIRLNRNPYSAAFQYPGSARLEAVTQRGHRSRRLDGGFQTTSRSSVFAARHPFTHSVPDSTAGCCKRTWAVPCARTRRSIWRPSAP